MSEGFFSRWSRRKREAEQDHGPADGSPPPLPHPGQAQALDPRPTAVPGAALPAGHGQAPDAADALSADLPTLEDVQQLTPQSDFQPFMRRGVGAEVRNAAMKKLFTDPHFNVMDGLDVYIDDYNLPDPMPAGMLRQMASAQFMKLVPEEGADRHLQDPAGSVVPEQERRFVAQSPDSSATAELPQHDHPDLQLQPDPAAGSAPPEPGAR